MKLRAWIAALLLTTLSVCAGADEIYRCGPTGAEFSQTPCSKGARIDVSDPRTDEQRSQALALASKTEAWGAALERDRLAIEASYRPALAGSLNSSAIRHSDDKPRSKPKLKHLHTRATHARPVSQPSLRLAGGG
ncbi:MAG: hypothetical protein ACKVOX_00265 [Rhizobacter sp.]